MADRLIDDFLGNTGSGSKKWQKMFVSDYERPKTGIIYISAVSKAHRHLRDLI
jgi:hypothetical protein